MFDSQTGFPPVNHRSMMTSQQQSLVATGFNLATLPTYQYRIVLHDIYRLWFIHVYPTKHPFYKPFIPYYTHI